MTEATATEEEAHRPDDFELGAAWDEVVDEMEQRRSPVSAVVLIEPRFVRVLHMQFGRHCEVLGEQDGRARVRLAAHTPLSIAERIAGWGATVEVTESAPVRVELARIGAELTERYGRGDK
nr:WYL domain-containing protein [Actinophytocola sp.]